MDFRPCFNFAENYTLLNVFWFESYLLLPLKFTQCLRVLFDDGKCRLELTSLLCYTLDN
jgi:hypothetical protein